MGVEFQLFVLCFCFLCYCPVVLLLLLSFVDDVSISPDLCMRMGLLTEVFIRWSSVFVDTPRHPPRHPPFMPPLTPPGSWPSKVFPYDVWVSIFPALSQTYSSQIDHNLDAVQATSISWIDHSSHSSNPLQTSCLRAACLGHSTRWTYVDYVQEAELYRKSFAIWYSITLRRERLR